jgi:hypothetical protein
MHYLIDGYNLLHHVGRLPAGRVANLEPARIDLLRLLQTRFKNEPGQVTVVFDAQGAPPRVPEQQQYLGIEVRFTLREEADDLIEAIIRRVAAPQQLTIVTNDRRIKEAARRRRCPVIECVAFWESLTQKPKPRPEPVPEEERPAMTHEDVDEWLREFGDMEDDGFDPKPL